MTTLKKSTKQTLSKTPMLKNTTMMGLGGSFKINGVLVEVKPTDKMLTSRGEQDGGVIQVDAFARF